MPNKELEEKVNVAFGKIQSLEDWRNTEHRALLLDLGGLREVQKNQGTLLNKTAGQVEGLVTEQSEFFKDAREFQATVSAALITLTDDTRDLKFANGLDGDRNQNKVKAEELRISNKKRLQVAGFWNKALGETLIHIIKWVAISAIIFLFSSLFYYTISKIRHESEQTITKKDVGNG